MNETTLNLAARISFALNVVCSDTIGFSEKDKISKYYTKLGVTSKTIKETDAHRTNKKQIDDLCHEVNNKLRLDQKICLLLLIQDCMPDIMNDPRSNHLIFDIYHSLGVDNSLFEKFHKFLSYNDPLDIDDKNYLLLSPREENKDEMLEGKWIEDNAPQVALRSGQLEIDQFKNHLLVMFVEPIKSYVVRCFNVSGKLFDQDVEKQCRFRIIGPGGELSIKGVPVITFSFLKNSFIHTEEKGELLLHIDNIEYLTAKETRNINSFSAEETTGQLIGIVGKEGVGKSTLLKLLAGKIKPSTGSIYINGYDLWKNKYLLKGIIGFVPEEDLLFEELTVADNLSLTARLYYSNLSGREIDAKVNSVLSRLDLLELKHVVVGSVMSKHIQPGQRRLINIALELLREPQILLVDNALSGLGMTDASKVIQILHEYSFSGNLVITSISQADKDTFMLFDEIWVFDEGGRAVYKGPVKSAVDFLNQHLKLADQELANIDPSKILDLVNYKLPDKIGHVWKRVMEPEDWHRNFIGEQVKTPERKQIKSLLPARILKTPNLEVQLLIFSIRNLKCKFSKVNDIIRAVLTGPVLALFVALLLHYTGNATYTFVGNTNIGLYQFFSIILMLFLGLILSADEIVMERNIIEKEEYLEFSRFSYLNSKILYLFPVIAFQSLLYVIVGNIIMGIKELLWVYWIVLFSSAAFGILLGLFLSSSVRKTNTLYKGLLPLVMVVQLLLGGGLIPFDRLNLGQGKYTPVLSDLMVSRWGYEALAVEQFKNNSYEKLLYNEEKQLAQSSYYTLFLIPELEEMTEKIENRQPIDSVGLYSEVLENELRKVAASSDLFPFEYVNNIEEIPDNPFLYQEMLDYLTYLRIHFYDRYENDLKNKEFLMRHLQDSLGTENINGLFNNYHNTTLADIVTGADEPNEFEIIDGEIVHTKDAIYQDPLSNYGRAGFFAPMKMINKQQSETLWFNISMIWLLSSLCYLLVLFDATGKIRKSRKIIPG